MAMVNNRFSISPVPTVQLHASAALQQRSARQISDFTSLKLMNFACENREIPTLWLLFHQKLLDPKTVFYKGLGTTRVA